MQDYCDQGDSADFILVDSLAKMNVIETWIKGTKSI